MQSLFTKTSLFGLVVFLFASCTEPTLSKKDDNTLIDGHPAWSLQGNIYEVNIRQYTPEGTFKAFEAHLTRLKEMGVQTLWFMPINPISKGGRKGDLGSYYAVASYTAINPEYGTLEEWNHLVTKAHELGFKVMIDWVPNHSGADHPWLKNHPDFYVKDSVTGEPTFTADWSDTRELNYDNKAMQDSMIESMKYWIKTSDIDGYRVDVAWGVPDAFWKRCLPELKKMKPGMFFLAEAEGGNYHTDGFDATYPWNMLHMINKIAAGERTADAIDSVRLHADSTIPANAIQMYFTSNHDENSWNKSDYGTMPGAIHAPFAVFTQTMGRSVPLIYSGQEEPVLDSLSFFYKDTIHFNKFERAPFYKTLLAFRKSNPAMASNALFHKVIAGNEKAIYAYTREGGGKKAFIILNLSGKAQEIKITDPALYGKALDIFSNQTIEISDKVFSINAWGYKVYSYY